ncbi:MAG: hypothetical protein DME42_04120, partial [Verrucomicrobia bacterium]
AGLTFQVALPARLLLAVESRSVRTLTAKARNVDGSKRRPGVLVESVVFIIFFSGFAQGSGTSVFSCRHKCASIS